MYAVRRKYAGRSQSTEELNELPCIERTPHGETKMLHSIERRWYLSRPAHETHGRVPVPFHVCADLPSSPVGPPPTRLLDFLPPILCTIQEKNTSALLPNFILIIHVVADCSLRRGGGWRWK